MILNLLTPEWARTIEVEAVFIPGTVGEFEVLKDHAPIISSMAPGTVKWRVGSKLETQAVKGGVAKVGGNVIDICAEL